MVMLGLSLALDSESPRRAKKINTVTFKGKCKISFLLDNLLQDGIYFSAFFRGLCVQNFL